MKRLLALLLILVLCSGCTSGGDEVGQATVLRSRIQSGKQCTFRSVVTADYGDATYTFEMDCVWDVTGTMNVTLTAPETISGVSATIQENTGKLIFDDKAVFFSQVADEQITPICGPWLLMKALSGGYVSGAGKDGDGLHIQIDDSYAKKQFCVHIWTNENSVPVFGEIVWQGRRILSMDIKDFVIL